jgi:predicted nucleic acid-binding Zn ribbon protein
VPDAERARLAAEALARARTDARARGSYPAHPDRRPPPPGRTAGSAESEGAQERPDGSDRAGRTSGADNPDERDKDQAAGDPGNTAGTAGGSAGRSAGPPGLPDGGAALGKGPGFPVPPASRRRPRRDEPQPLNSAVAGLLDQQGWRLAAATGSVFARWAQIVGPELAAHTTPEGLAGGELTVTADSTAWATQVRLLAAQLVRRLNAELGDGTVTRVKVRGPAAPRQQGQWRVRGGRGPRDTYG